MRTKKRGTAAARRGARSERTGAKSRRAHTRTGIGRRRSEDSTIGAPLA